MPIEGYELVSYAVSLASEGGPSGRLRPVATIHAKGGEGERAVQVYMRFYQTDRELPKNSRVDGEDGSLMFMVSFRYEQLAPAIDLLRNEKPMFFNFNDKSNTGYLATSDEPVGEGEIDADYLKSQRRPPPPAAPAKKP